MLAIVSLITGLVSVPLSFCCTLISFPLQIVSIVCGGIALSKISKSNGALKGKEMAIIGIILASLTIVLAIALLALGLGGALLQEITR